MMESYDLALRQLGDQEVNIAAIATPITKSAEVLREPSETRFVVERGNLDCTAWPTGTGVDRCSDRCAI